MTSGNEHTDDASGGTETPRPTLLRRHFWIAYVMGAFGLAMNALGNFLVPLRARELGASFETIGLIVASAAISSAVLSIYLGGFTDRLGPRRAFILACSLNAAVCAAFVLVTNYWLLIPLQVAYGSTRSFGWIASQNYVTGIGRPEDRTAIAGRFGFFSNVGPMVGPLIAGIIAQVVGYRWAFLFLAGYSLSFALLGFFAAETGAAPGAATRGRGASLRTALSLMKMRGMQIVMLLTSSRLWTNWAWASFFPVFLSDNGMLPSAIGSVIFARALVSTLTAPTTGYWTRIMSKQTATAVGLGCGALGLGISAFFTTLPGAYIPAALVGVAIGVSLPLLLSILADVVPEEQRGVAIGLRISTNQTAAAAAPIFAGTLIAAGATLGFVLSGGVAAGILVIALYLHRGMQRPGADTIHQH